MEDVLLGNKKVSFEILEGIKKKLQELFPDHQFNPQIVISLDSDDDEKMDVETINSEDDTALDKEVEGILKHTGAVKVEEGEEMECEEFHAMCLFPPKPNVFLPISFDDLDISPEKSPKKTVKTPSKAATTPKRPQKPQESIASYRLKKTLMPPASAYVKPSNKQVNYLTVPYKENQGPQKQIKKIDPRELDIKLNLFKEKFFIRMCAERKKKEESALESNENKNNARTIEVVKASVKSVKNKTPAAKKKRRMSCWAEPANEEAAVPSNYNLRSRSKSMLPTTQGFPKVKAFHHMRKDVTKKNEQSLPVVKMERIKKPAITVRNEKRPAENQEKEIDWSMEPNSLELLDLLPEKKKFKCARK